MASPIGFSRGPAGQGFQDHVYAVAVSNKRDRWANNKGPVLELGMPSVLQPLASRVSRELTVRVVVFMFIKQG